MCIRDRSSSLTFNKWLISSELMMPVNSAWLRRLSESNGSRPHGSAASMAACHKFGHTRMEIKKLNAARNGNKKAERSYQTTNTHSDQSGKLLPTNTKQMTTQNKNEKRNTATTQQQHTASKSGKPLTAVVCMLSGNRVDVYANG